MKITRECLHTVLENIYSIRGKDGIARSLLYIGDQFIFRKPNQDVGE